MRLFSGIRLNKRTQEQCETETAEQTQRHRIDEERKPAHQDASIAGLGHEQPCSPAAADQRDDQDAGKHQQPEDADDRVHYAEPTGR